MAKKNTFLLLRFVVSGVVLLCVQGCIGNKTDEQHIDLSIYNAQVALEHYPNVLPIVVIGSGPAGLAAGIYGARDNTKTVVIEGPTPGGLLMLTTEVENWPGKKSILGPDIIKELHEQAESVGAEFIQDVVEKVETSRWPYEITLAGGDVLHAMSLIVATGASPRKLSVPGEEMYWGRGVTACAVCDARFYAGMDVVVVGGGDSAVEEALQLANHVRSVTILVRKGAMRAASSMQDRLKDNPSIKIVYNVEVQKVLGDDTHVTGVELINHKTHEIFTMPTSGIFLAAGHIPNSALFKGILKLDDNGYIQTMHRTQHTSVPGIFAAGEVEDHRYRQAGVSFGDGTKAALDALGFLRHIGFSKNMKSGYMEQEGESEGSAVSSQQEQELAHVESLSELQDIVQQEKRPIVLDFYTHTCPSCMQMLPFVRSLAQELRHEVCFLKIDADKAVDLVKKYFVYKVPCLIIIKDGNLIARYSEPVASKERLKALIEEFITSKNN